MRGPRPWRSRSTRNRQARARARLATARRATSRSIPVVRPRASATGRHGRLDPARDIARRVRRRWLRRIDDGHVAVGRRWIVDALGPGGGRHKQRDGDQNWSFHTISPEQERQGGDHRSFTAASRFVASPHRGTATSLPSRRDALGRLSGRKPRHMPDRGRPGRCLGGLRLLRRRRDDAGARGVGLILDPLRNGRRSQERQNREDCQNAAHGRTPERGALRNVTGFPLKASTFERHERLWRPEKAAGKLPRCRHLQRKNLAKRPHPGYLIGLDDRLR